MKDIEAGNRIIIECIETNKDKPYCCDMCFSITCYHTALIDVVRQFVKTARM